MFKLKGDKIKVHNPTTGMFEGMHIARGESTYEIAKRKGFTGTVEEFIELHAPDELLTKVSRLENELMISGAELDGIELYVKNGIFTVVYDDKDNTTHSGKIGNMKIAVTESGIVTVTVEEDN